jgi:hypothetical protein
MQSADGCSLPGHRVIDLGNLLLKAYFPEFLAAEHARKRTALILKRFKLNDVSAS